MSVSIIILTLNEENNLPVCLESLSWCDDIVVFDSYSSDSTVEVAKQAGARVVQRRFDNWSAHQNWAVENIDFRYPWVWYVDADEVTPPELAEELIEKTSDGSRPEVAFLVRRKNIFMGRELKHGGLENVWIARLWKPNAIRWKRSVNPVPSIDGEVGHLQNYLVHHFFSKGFDGWFERHNRYSNSEAEETLKGRQDTLDWRGLVSRDAVRRRLALKELSYRLPGRPWLKFFYMYFLRLGFLDGRPGLTYCALQSVYEYMICLKVKELRRREDGLPI